MNRYSPTTLTASLLALGLMSFPLPSFASAFQLFEQDAASIGDYHAGYAAEAADAFARFDAGSDALEPHLLDQLLIYPLMSAQWAAEPLSTRLGTRGSLWLVAVAFWGALAALVSSFTYRWP